MNPPTAPTHDVSSRGTPSRGDQYKRRTDLDGARHARRDVQVQIRKDKTRELVHAKRMSMNREEDANEETAMVLASRDAMDYAASIAEIMSGDGTRALEAMREIRRSVSKGSNKENARAIERATNVDGLVPLIVRVLADPSSTAEHRFEAAWIVTNIASGPSKSTRAVVEAGAIPPLVRGIVFGDTLLRQQCVWALGNIASDSIDLRKHVIASGALEAMSTSLDGIVAARAHTSFGLYYETLDNYAWTAYCIVRGTGVRMWMSADALGTLTIVDRIARGSGLDNMTQTLDNAAAQGDPKRAVRHVQNVLSNVVYCLSEISTIVDPSGAELANNVCETIQSLNLVSSIVRYTHFPPHSEDATPPELHSGCVILCGNLIASVRTENSDTFLRAGIVPAIIESLANDRLPVKSRREMCWIVSNLAAGAPNQVRAVVTPGVFAALGRCFVCGEDGVLREIAWTLCNMVTGVIDMNDGTSGTLMRLVCDTPGFLNALGKAMREKGQNLEFILRSIEFVSGLLSLEQKTGGEDVYRAMDESDVVGALEDLTVHNSEEARNAAGLVIDTFYGATTEDYGF